MYLFNEYVMKSYFVSHCSRCSAYRINKRDENPYPCKHIHSYLTRTYMLVRKRNSENNKNGGRGRRGRGGEEGEGGGEKEYRRDHMSVCVYFFNCVSSMEKNGEGKEEARSGDAI